MFFGSNVYGQDEISLKMKDDPMYTSSDTDQPGVLIEIVLEMSKYLNVELSKDFLPWRRAQYETIIGNNSVIFPLTRTESREQNYKWLCKLFDVQVAFITRKGGPIINSYDEATELTKFAVVLGTPHEERLDIIMKEKQLALSFARLKSDNAFDLFANNKEIIALYGDIHSTSSIWERKGYQKKFGELQYGVTLQILPIWIATGKNATQIKPEDWKAALDKVKASGFFDKVLDKALFH